MPMIVRIVPITTGGKHFAGLLNTGANRKVAMPAVITAPYTASRPAVPPCGARTDGDHGRDRGGGDALDQGQPGADLPDAERLDYRGDAAGQQVGVDEVDQLLAGEAQGVAEQDGDDDRRRVEREDVLEALEGEPGEGEQLVDGVHLLARGPSGGLSGDASCHLCLAFAR